MSKKREKTQTNNNESIDQIKSIKQVKLDDSIDIISNNNELIDSLEYEDPFGDDYEDELIEFDEVEYVDEEGRQAIDNNDEIEVDEANISTIKQVWRPGIDQLAEGEELEHDPSAYIMYHSLKSEWPCLSFDILKDNLGEGRHRFPMTMFAVTGSQADRSDNNKITLLKLSDLSKTHIADSDDENESDEEDDNDDVDTDPTLEHVNIPHYGGVNRIRSMPQSPGIIATMADTGCAHIFDLQSTYQSMQNKVPRIPGPTKPSYTYKGHRDEGFALDWSPATAGRLATGDCNGVIHVWNIDNPIAPSSAIHSIFTGHKSSVEDIQWSPTEATVFCSASADKTVRVWDVRGKSGPQITVDDAHLDDVNVISWNRDVAYLLASGCDDGSFKVWDLRAIRKGTTLAHFTYHKGPITSIEWAPHDESVIAMSSADEQLTIWDLSVEADDPTIESSDPLLKDYPPQLLFIHQ
eukprot:gene18759-24526_t